MNKKYELVKESNGLYQIRALRSFSDVKVGDIGGWIRSEDNLSHKDTCWVYDNAKVYGNAKVCGYAEVYGNAEVCGNAKVYDSAKVYGNAKVCGSAEVSGNAEVYGNVLVCDNAKAYGNAKVCGNARIYGKAEVCGNAKVCGNAEVYGNAKVCGNAEVYGSVEIGKSSDFIVFKNNLTSGRYYTYTFPNDSWRIGCFYGTTKELELHLETEADGNQRFEYGLAIDYVTKLRRHKEL